MKIFELNQGYKTFIDDDDYEKIKNNKWFCDGRYIKRHLYLGKNKFGKNIYKVIYFHQFIINTPKGMDTDHINGNKLDNRKQNLRIISRSKNIFFRPNQINNVSGYSGITKRKDCNRWCARIKIMNKEKHLGLFKTLEEAIMIRIDAEKKYFGALKIL